MGVDNVNWRREMKNFVGAELKALKSEVAQLRADLNGGNNAGTSAKSATDSTASDELGALKSEVAQLRADLNTLIELVKVLTANHMLANVESEISAQTGDETQPITTNADLSDEIESLKDDVDMARDDLTAAIAELREDLLQEIHKLNCYEEDEEETYWSETTTIINPTGIHARPASVFVQTASKFRSKVSLSAKGKTCDAKSILMIMSMGLTKGTDVTITAEGYKDAREAVQTLVGLIDDGFGEDLNAPPEYNEDEDDEVFVAVRSILARNLYLDEEEIYMGWSEFDSYSSDFADAINEIENEFGIYIPSDAYESFYDVEDIVNYVKNAQENNDDDETYCSRTTTIENRTGIHARPASLFVQTAGRFRSKITISAKGKTVDAKSILMIMALGLSRGTEVTITADGPDAREAVTTLVRLIDDKFGEE